MLASDRRSEEAKLVDSLCTAFEREGKRNINLMFTDLFDSDAVTLKMCDVLKDLLSGNESHSHFESCGIHFYGKSARREITIKSTFRGVSKETRELWVAKLTKVRRSRQMNSSNVRGDVSERFVYEIVIVCESSYVI